MVELSEQTKFVAVFGRKGTGKTSWLRKALNKIQGKKTILLIDTMNNFSKVDAIDVNSGDEFLDRILFSTYENKTFRLKTDSVREIIIAIYTAYSKGNISIFMDECDVIFGHKMNSSIREVILKGRNQGTDLFIATLRPHKLHPDVRAQADIIICFSIKNELDIKSISRDFGGFDLEKEIFSLEGHQYIKFHVSSGKFDKFSGARKYNRTGKYAGVHKKRLQKKAGQSAK